MNKTIKIIDLLNKIANGKKLPKRIKWRDKIWDYIEKEQDYINHNIYFFEGFTQIRTKDFVTDTVEIIEDEDINIQDIEKLDKNLKINDLENPFGINEEIIWTEIIKQHNKINDLIEAVKKLDKEINNE